MNRSDVAHDHLALEHALRIIVDRFDALTTDGRDVIDVLTDLEHLDRALKGHHQEEERDLFAYTTRQHGPDPALKELVEQHRRLERELAEVADLVNYEGDLQGAKRALARFSQTFDNHTLKEANFFASRWDELFPGEVMAG